MDAIRERWAGRLPFVMAAVGSAVGLGNIWRFPKVVFDNGGGVFLIPYFIALITAGIPLMIVEYALGQKYQGGAPQAIAAITKKFKWVGWFALLVGTVITFYYIAIMAWAFHYTGAALNVSWARSFDHAEYEVDRENGKIIQNKIDKDDVYLYYIYKTDEEKERVKRILGKYNVNVLTEDELTKIKEDSGRKRKYISFTENIGNYLLARTLDYPDKTWKEIETHNTSLKEEIEKTKKEAAQNDSGLTSVQEETINNLKSKKIGVLGHMMKPKWSLFLGAFITWLAIFLIIFKGVKNVGKVVMFTVPIPVLIIVVIIIKGLTLPGAWEGIAFYLRPDLSKLFEPEIWMAAYGQIFFSLSLGFGILIAYASYQPEESDIANNAFLTSFANCSTSFLGGFAVFTVLGYLAKVSGVEVGNVVKDGISLAFVTYPTAIAHMGAVAGVIIGVLFFICLLSLGIDSAFSILEGVITGVKDNFKTVSKPVLTAVFCMVGFLVTSFVFCSRSGLMWLDIADHWMGTYGLALVGLFECIAIGYFADLDDLKKFINKHSEIKVHYWFDVFIKVITPSVLIFLLSRQFLADIGKVYSGYDAVLSWSVNIAGWGLFGFLIILATVFGKNYHLLIWEIVSIAVFYIFRIIYSAAGIANPGTIAAMTTLGAVLLLGGFFHCLYIALTEKLPAGSEEEETEPEDEQTDTDTEGLQNKEK